MTASGVGGDRVGVVDPNVDLVLVVGGDELGLLGSVMVDIIDEAVGWVFVLFRFC